MNLIRSCTSSPSHHHNKAIFTSTYSVKNQDADADAADAEDAEDADVRIHQADDAGNENKHKQQINTKYTRTPGS